MNNRTLLGKIVLVEDDTALRDATVQTLDLAELDVQAFESANQALRYLSPGFDGCIVTDIRMDGMDGLQLFKQVKELDPDLPVILITGHGDVAMAVRAMHDGAFDFLTKPFATDHLIAVIGKALQSRRLVLENRALRKSVAEQGDNLIARSRTMEQFRSTIAQLARTDIDILIQGEAGTGKELWIRELHKQSPRYAGPFVVLPSVTCTSDVELSEAIKQSEGGILLIDGCDALPIKQQAKLAGMLDDRDRARTDAVGRIGFRLVLSETIPKSAGGLVSELEHRIGSVQLQLPPLRERRDDIAPLFARFVAEALQEVGKKRYEMSAADRKKLFEYGWPGNVRELRNFAFAAVLNLPRQVMGEDWQSAKMDLQTRLAEFERMMICEALEATQGNVVRAVEKLRVPRKTLYEKLARLGIDPSRFRKESVAVKRTVASK